MDGEKHARLVEAICRAYSLRQFDELVRRALNTPREHYAIANDLKTIVDKFIEELELVQDQLLTFLLKLREWTSRPELRAAINSYFGLTNAAGDPYTALLVFDEPFVNRQVFRERLCELFTNPWSRVLITRGPRACGKTHSRWLIRHVAETIGAEVVVVDFDLLDNPDNEVRDIVDQLINDMYLPPNEFRDRIAQASTISKGFASALRGHSRTAFKQSGQQWCLVFDHFDRDVVPQSAREFVRLLVSDAATLQLQNVWVIVLGYKELLTPSIARRVLDEEIFPMQPPDVERFLDQMATSAGKPIQPGGNAARRDEIFNGLVVPLNHDGMWEMARRLHKHIIKLREVGI
jgi:hypothetical protein